MKKYYVYALVKDGKAVYIGCTSNPIRRKFAHKKDKVFDKFTVLKQYQDKKTALAVENGLIIFLTLFGDGEWYNAENILTSLEKLQLRGLY
jgi:hypothetical protein